jgi:hypothetical protein
MSLCLAERGEPAGAALARHKQTTGRSPRFASAVTGGRFR